MSTNMNIVSWFTLTIISFREQTVGLLFPHEVFMLLVRVDLKAKIMGNIVSIHSSISLNSCKYYFWILRNIITRLTAISPLRTGLTCSK